MIDGIDIRECVLPLQRAEWWLRGDQRQLQRVGEDNRIRDIQREA